MRICFFIRWPERWFEWNGTYKYVGWESHLKKTLLQCGSIFTLPLRGIKLLVAKRLHKCENLSCHRDHNVPSFLPLLAPSPPPPPKKTLYIAIISNFSWVLQSSQENRRHWLCQIFRGKQGALWSRWEEWSMNFAQLLKWNNSINNNHYVPRAFLKNCTFDVFKSEKPSLGRLDK